MASFKICFSVCVCMTLSPQHVWRHLCDIQSLLPLTCGFWDLAHRLLWPEKFTCCTAGQAQLLSNSAGYLEKLVHLFLQNAGFFSVSCNPGLHFSQGQGYRHFATTLGLSIYYSLKEPETKFKMNGNYMVKMEINLSSQM